MARTVIPLRQIEDVVALLTTVAENTRLIETGGSAQEIAAHLGAATPRERGVVGLVTQAIRLRARRRALNRLSRDYGIDVTVPTYDSLRAEAEMARIAC